jgi:hypothetical protein
VEARSYQASSGSGGLGSQCVGVSFQGHGREVHPTPLEEDRRMPAALLGAEQEGEVWFCRESGTETRKDPMLMESSCGEQIELLRE